MIRALLLILVLLVPGCATAEVPPGGVAVRTGSGGLNRSDHLEKPYVIIVSFDGFRHDYLDRIEARNFRRVIDGGVRAGGLLRVFATKTCPNPYSMARGRYAA